MRPKTKGWISLLLVAFLTCLGASVVWTYHLFTDELERPPELCLSNQFPAKSISLEDRSEEFLSVFEEKEFAVGDPTAIYSAFEERFPEAYPLKQRGSREHDIDEMYRFFWLRTFHRPFLFRIYRSGAEFYLVAKQTDGRSGYQLGNLAMNSSKRLSNSDWCRFIELLDEADFWSMDKIKVGTVAHDGAFWVMEGFREGRYYVASQQSPPGGPFREACLYLMKLSDMRIDENSPEFY